MKKNLFGKLLVLYIVIIVAIFYTILLTGCKGSGITTKQKAKCIYNDGKTAIFEITYKCKNPNLSICTTELSCRADKQYKVGNNYIVVIKK